MKDSFRSRFSKEKMAKFFDKEGFYIVLFLCVCIVAITAVWVSRTGVKSGQNQDGVIKDNKAAVSTPSKETSSVPTSADKQKVAVTEDKAAKQESKSATSESKQTSSTSTTKSTSPEPVVSFVNPIKGDLASTLIEMDYSPTDLVCFEALNEWRTHSGIDFKAAEGTEVLSVYGGKVVEIRNDNDFQGGLGWTVVVDHENGYKSIYANLNEKVAVKKNQSIKKGEKIGNVGKTAIYESDTSEESKEISHLHFELLKKGAKAYENVDPKKYLTMQK